MSEEAVGGGSVPESNGTGIDPTAVALALAGASRQEADSFLRDQRSLITGQLHHLRQQDKHLHLDMWEKRLGVWLRAATFAVGVTVVAGAAFLLWDASNSNGLVIEPFSVPPDLAQRGLTGEVIAARLLDRLADMQNQTVSNRASKSYANSWDEKIFQVGIPETGVSLSELDNFLRKKLGHDIHVTGDVVHTSSGLSMTARAQSGGADAVDGSEVELDAMIRRSAESVYRLTQPYRYGYFLATHGRATEAMQVLKDLATSGPISERTWGYYGQAGLTADRIGIDEGLSLLDRSIELQNDNILAYMSVAQTAQDESLPEQVIAGEKKTLSLLSSKSRSMINPAVAPFMAIQAQAQIDLQAGAFHDASLKQARVIDSGLAGRYGLPAILAQDEVGEHDLGAARSALTNTKDYYGYYRGTSAHFRIWAEMLIASAAEDWLAALSKEKAIEPLLRDYPGLRSLKRSTTDPLAAYVEARLGHFAMAEARIATTPNNCNACLRTRARIAELRGQHARADWWFTRAVENAPSIPFAYSDRGEALLGRGNFDEAITQFRLANQKGPHFADPLVYWGEALIAKNQSHRALAKFSEAEKYAPNWGRLHLKWGEALVYAGKKDEARKQFARAAHLDLTPPEKIELALHP